jgi:hypothetical protein
MMQIWQQIRLGKHVGFEEGEWCATRCDVGRRDAVLVPLSVSGAVQHGQHLWSAVVVNSEPDRAVLGLGCLGGLVSDRAIWSAFFPVSVPVNVSVAVQPSCRY